jgi:hypothetical protein
MWPFKKKSSARRDDLPEGYASPISSPQRTPSTPSACSSKAIDFSEEMAGTSAAVIGAGYLGSRIIAELLLLGVEVDVFERGLVEKGPLHGQRELDVMVFQNIAETYRDGLLELNGMNPPSVSAGDCYWEPFEGEPRRAPRWSASIKEAVRGKAIVIECVPDSLSIKTAVFVEAAAAAPPGVLLATSTLNIPLGTIQDAVDAKVSKQARLPRVVGLRFLTPVVYVPFVEVTLTEAQANGQDREDLMALLARWGKGSFLCDVQGAASNSHEDEVCWSLGMKRLRLESRLAKTRQQGEARLRNAHRRGPEAVKALRPADLYSFEDGEDMCCICLEKEPTVTSLFCGHRAMCDECTKIIESGQRRCPLCRVRFVKSSANATDAMVAPAQEEQEEEDDDDSTNVVEFKHGGLEG